MIFDVVLSFFSCVVPCVGLSCSPLFLLVSMGDSQALYLRGTLTGHNGWITAIATGEPGAQDTVLTASRGMSTFLPVSW